MDRERLLNRLEEVYGKNPVERDDLNRRDALPSEIEEVLENGKDDDNHLSKEKSS